MTRDKRHFYDVNNVKSIKSFMKENMDRKPHAKYRLILDFKSQFPEKLYDVANDGYLIHWNRNGSITVRDEQEFEDTVMRLYPGFLQIPTILNFKRLFREYGFERTVNQNHQLEYSHPCFIRGRRDLLPDIKTRRKSFRTPNCKGFRADEIVIPTDDNRRYSSRKRQKTARFSFGEDDEKKLCVDAVSVDPSAQTYHVRNPLQRPITPTTPELASTQKPEQHHPPKVQEPPRSTSREVMQTFAEKEFDAEEYNKWIEEQRKLEAAKGGTIIEITDTNTNSNANEFWWMYGSKPDDVVNVVDISRNNDSPGGKSNEAFTPCGFCKCCLAVSNYVHVFGEVPENIQVIDYAEEIIETPADLVHEHVDHSFKTI